MNQYNVIVGRILARHRRAHKIKQREVGAALGRGRSTIANIERGDIGLGVDDFMNYCLAIGEDPAEIMREVQDATRKR